MGTTGLIFGAIVAAWLAYLVPMYLRRESANHTDVFDPASRFSADLRIVRDCVPDDGDSTSGGAGSGHARVRVSTPLTRRAALESMRRAERMAARRRLNVIAVLLIAAGALVALSAFGRTPWWSVAIPSGLLIAFLAVARVTVQAMHRSFDRRLAAMDNEGREETVLVAEPVAQDATPTTGVVDSIELGMPVGKPGSLWDPLPITRANYVSALPASGRTVRTIDLSAPEPARGDNKPVVADAPEISMVSGKEVAEVRLRAVGE